MAPALLLRALRPGEPLSAFGLSWAGLRGHERAYLVLFLLALPLVVVASMRPSFQDVYPFYRHASRSAIDFVLWEALYALQFVSLEFFFRGFLLHTLKRDLGAYAIFVAVVPYCMIHFRSRCPRHWARSWPASSWARCRCGRARCWAARPSTCASR